MPEYKRPPITEAAIEVRFADHLSKDLIEKLHARFKPDYSSSDSLTTLGVHVDVQHRQTKFDEKFAGYKLASADRTDVFQFAPPNVVVSRLAPYLGWDHFRARGYEIWRDWKRIAGYHKIQRIGVRYINRIDIPFQPGNKLTLQEYVKIYPEVPEIGIFVPDMERYSMQVVGPVGDDNCSLIVHSATVPSPLVNHSSLLLDIDIIREVDVPQKDDELWAQLDRIRVYKNRIFEATVTDKARELFNA